MVKAVSSKLRCSQAADEASERIGALVCSAGSPHPASVSAVRTRLERIAAIADQAGAGRIGRAVRKKEGDLLGHFIRLGITSQRRRHAGHGLVGGLLASRLLDEIGV